MMQAVDPPATAGGTDLIQARYETLRTRDNAYSIGLNPTAAS
jgi:hypothetical protein